MKALKESSENYFKVLSERGKKSRIHQSYQAVGVEIANVLQDFKHTALYIKLAKTKDGEALLRMAKAVAEKPNIQNKGAYFMKILHTKK